MKKLLLLIAFAAVILSCSRPGTAETFVSASKVNAAGQYEFPVDIYDSTASYSLSFYARRDISIRRRGAFGPSRLVVSWQNPEGRVQLRDTVYMDMGTARGTVVEYRSGVRLPKGVWTLQVDVSQPGPRFRGLGLVCSKDGTR